MDSECFNTTSKQNKYSKLKQRKLRETDWNLQEQMAYL